MYKSILIGIDFSDPSVETVRWAVPGEDASAGVVVGEALSCRVCHPHLTSPVKGEELILPLARGIRGGKNGICLIFCNLRSDSD